MGSRTRATSPSAAACFIGASTSLTHFRHNLTFGTHSVHIHGVLPPRKHVQRRPTHLFTGIETPECITEVPTRQTRQASWPRAMKRTPVQSHSLLHRQRENSALSAKLCCGRAFIVLAHRRHFPGIAGVRAFAVLCRISSRQGQWP